MNTANIANITLAPKATIVTSMPTKTVQGSENDFSSYVKQNKQANQSKSEVSTKDKDTNSTQSQTYPRKDITKASDSTPDVSKEESDKVDSAMNEFKDKIEELLKKKLGVSDEQIVSAMNALGLSMQDLLDPKKLSSLIAKLTQTTDNMSLVMSDSYQEIMQGASQLTNDLLKELGIDMKQLKTICDWMNEQKQSLNPKGNFNTNAALPNAETKSAENAPKTEAVDTQKASLDTTNRTVDKTVLSSDKENKETVAASTSTVKDAASIAGKNQTVSNDTQTVVQNSAKDQNQQSFGQSSSNQSNSNQSNSNQLGNKEQNALLADAKQIKQTEHGVETKSEDVKVEQKPEHLHMADFMKQSNITNQTDALQMKQFQQSYVNTQSLLEQISEYTKVFNFHDATTMQMQLNPENLGKIYVQVTQKAGEITATIAATDERVKDALQAQVANLKDSLNQQGIKVNAVEVTIASHEFEQNLEQNANSNQQSQNQSNGNMQQENQNRQTSTRTLNLNYLSNDNFEDLPEELVMKIMKDNGNQVDITV